MGLLIVIFPVAYLLGSIPASVWLGRAFKGIDLREHGSGNAGATNAFRVLGKPIGIAVLMLDTGKGYLAVSLSHFQHQISPGSEGWIILQIGLGMCAVLGHLYPVFAGFRGGKGVATLAGTGLAIHPFGALAAIGIYILAFMISKVSALGSLSAAISYPVWIIAVFRTEFTSLRIFSLAVPLLVILTHRSNLKRLFRGK
jgi:glycerol-3-phosphate acyltransferase PlsY